MKLNISLMEVFSEDEKRDFEVLKKFIESDNSLQITNYFLNLAANNMNSLYFYDFKIENILKNYENQIIDIINLNI
jgi:hypothetical protein